MTMPFGALRRVMRGIPLLVWVTLCCWHGIPHAAAQETAAGASAIFCQLQNPQTMRAYFSGVLKRPDLTKFRVQSYAGRFQRAVNQSFGENFERQHWTCRAFSSQLKAASEQATAQAWLESQGYRVNLVGTF
jgi:hypothetical protein